MNNGGTLRRSEKAAAYSNGRLALASRVRCGNRIIALR